MTSSVYCNLLKYFSKRECNKHKSPVRNTSKAVQSTLFPWRPGLSHRLSGLPLSNAPSPDTALRRPRDSRSCRNSAGNVPAYYIFRGLHSNLTRSRTLPWGQEPTPPHRAVATIGTPNLSVKSQQYPQKAISLLASGPAG